MAHISINFISTNPTLITNEEWSKYSTEIFDMLLNSGFGIDYIDDLDEMENSTEIDIEQQINETRNEINENIKDAFKKLILIREEIDKDKDYIIKNKTAKITDISNILNKTYGSEAYIQIERDEENNLMEIFLLGNKNDYLDTLSYNIEQKDILNEKLYIVGTSNYHY
jgi:hypothetical protein